MKQVAFKLVCFAIAGALAFAATSLSQGLRLAIAFSVGLPSFVLMVTGRRQLGASFSVRPKAKALVTTGLYSRIRHPMYLFLDLFLLALIVASGWPVVLIAWTILVAVQTMQAQREEGVLANAFGADFEKYRARTWF